MELAEAATALGVHYQTAYRWVRTGILPATKVNGSWTVKDSDVRIFAHQRHTPQKLTEAIKVRDWERQNDRFYRALIVGDEQAAAAVVSRLRDGRISAVDLCDQLFLPTLSRVGYEWLTGKLTMAHQHRAAAIAERLLAGFAARPVGRPRGACVVATAPGDEHTFAALMATVVLRSDRWSVHHLGREIPGNEIALLMKEHDAGLAVVSYINGAAKAAADEICELLQSQGRRALVFKPGRTYAALVEEARQASLSSDAH